MSLSFPSKSGCPMCSIVSRASGSGSDATLPHPPASPVTPTSPNAPSSTSAASRPSRAAIRNGKAKEKDDGPEIIWHDENFTVYSERAHPVSSTAHLVIIFNLHVPSLYMLSTSDVPLLVKLRDLAHRLLTDLTSHIHYPPSPISPPPRLNPSSPSPPPSYPSPASEQPGNGNGGTDAPENGSRRKPDLESQFRVGFITPPFKDTQIPVKDHLHAHAYVAPMDRCSWWRSVAYSPIAWYAIEDLIAEIREESSNNRIRSSSSAGALTTTASNRSRSRPIDHVPNAGARSGTADGHETTERGLSGLMEMDGDLESGAGGGRSSLGSTYGYRIRERRNGSGSGSGGDKSPLPSPDPSSSRLSFNTAGYSSVASASSSKSPTPTSSTFVQSQARLNSGGSMYAYSPHTPESRPGSSLAPTGNLLSPAYPMASTSSSSSSSSSS